MINRYLRLLLEGKTTGRELGQEKNVLHAHFHNSLLIDPCKPTLFITPSLSLFKQQFLVWQSHWINVSGNHVKKGFSIFTFLSGFSPVCLPNEVSLDTYIIRSMNLKGKSVNWTCLLSFFPSSVLYESMCLNCNVHDSVFCSPPTALHSAASAFTFQLCRAVTHRFSAKDEERSCFGNYRQWIAKQ